VNWNNDSVRCDRTRESIADSIIGRVPIVDASAVDAHLAGCAACRAYRAECEAVWASLGELSVPPPPVDVRARFNAALWGEQVAALRAPRAWPRRGLLAAGLLGAMAFGYGAARRSLAGSAGVAPTIAAVPTDASEQYLLLLYDNEATGNLSPTQLQNIIAEYSAWARGLRAAGKLVSAEKLRNEPSAWFGGEVKVVGGDRLGGFFLIRVRDAAEAHQIAEACPHLKHGGRVEVRAIQKT
jgi:hypothetical protein